MPNNLEAGRLNRRIRIEKPVRTQDAEGTLTTAWETVATVSASIEPLSVNAFIAAQTLQSKITCRVTLRYRAGLNTAMQFVADDGTIYRPEGYLPDPNTGREYLTCPCTTLNQGT